MSTSNLKKNGGKQVKKYLSIVSAFILAVSALTVGLSGMSASAESLASRSLTISSAQASATGVSHAFQFDIGTTGTLEAIRFEYCTTPLGTCSAPTGINVNDANISLTLDEIENVNDSFAINTLINDNDTFEVTRTSGLVTAGDTVELTIGGVQNPSTNTYSPAGNNTFFVRITTYSDTFVTSVDDGVVAAAIVPLLTVSARVQEVLHFCIDNASTGGGILAATALGADCADFVTSYAVAGNSIDLGVVDNSTTGAVSPDADGNSADGVFMVRSNALNGTVIGYKAVQQSGTNHQGALRVVGATCNAGVVNVDRCFNSQTTKTTLAASTEQFGMTGRYINVTSSGTPTANLSLTAEYNSTSTVGYAWQEDGSFTSVATTVPSTDKVVDDEAVVLKFAAVAALTTPPGQYQAQADFIAVPTY